MSGTLISSKGAAGIGSVLLSDSFGQTLFVDTRNGSDSNNGRTPQRSLLTMAEAFDKLTEDGSTIYVIGDVREQISSPLGVQGCRIIGLANGNTRHDDGVRWRTPASATAATPLLTIREQGWELHNILFVPDANATTCVRLRRDEDAVNPDGSHAIISHCKFIGATVTGIGVEDYGGSHHDVIEDCEFISLTTAIKNTVGAGIASPLRWSIRRNWFLDNTNHINMPSNQCMIEDNNFDQATIVVITFGGTAGFNYVLRNTFDENDADIDIAHGYKGATNDTWRNYSKNTAAMSVGYAQA